MTETPVVVFCDLCGVGINLVKAEKVWRCKQCDKQICSDCRGNAASLCSECSPRPSASRPTPPLARGTPARSGASPVLDGLTDWLSSVRQSITNAMEASSSHSSIWLDEIIERIQSDFPGTLPVLVKEPIEASLYAVYDHAFVVLCSEHILFGKTDDGHSGVYVLQLGVTERSACRLLRLDMGYLEKRGKRPGDSAVLELQLGASTFVMRFGTGPSYAFKDRLDRFSKLMKKKGS